LQTIIPLSASHTPTEALTVTKASGTLPHTQQIRPCHKSGQCASDMSPASDIHLIFCCILFYQPATLQTSDLICSFCSQVIQSIQQPKAACKTAGQLVHHCSTLSFGGNSANSIRTMRLPLNVSLPNHALIYDGNESDSRCWYLFSWW